MAVDWARLYLEGASIPQIAERVGAPRSRVRTRLMASGVELRSRVEGIRLAMPRRKRPSEKRVVSAEGRASISAGRLAWAEQHAIGVSLKPSGYLEVTRGPEKGRGVHVLKMEARLGRRLLADECVHHIDGDRTNNEDNNLALMTASGHARLHRREEKLSGKIRERKQNGRLA